jgi:hypothetical protein
MPERSCLKNIGLPIENHAHIIKHKNRGLIKINSKRAEVKSKALFIIL